MSNEVVEPIYPKAQPKQTDQETEKKDQERRIKDILRMAKTEGVQRAIEQMKPAFHTGMPTPNSKKSQQR